MIICVYYAATKRPELPGFQLTLPGALPDSDGAISRASRKVFRGSPLPNQKHREIRVKSPSSTDWFRGKITGKPLIFHGKNPWFPVIFPLNQSIDINLLQIHSFHGFLWGKKSGKKSPSWFFLVPPDPCLRHCCAWGRWWITPGPMTPKIVGGSPTRDPKVHGWKTENDWMCYPLVI